MRMERGQKDFRLIKVGDMEYTPGEIDMTVSSFDEDVELHRAIVVQDAAVQSKKFVPESFDNAPKELIVQAEEPAAEEEPEPEKPAITEEELEEIRREAYQKGMSDGLARGQADGKKSKKSIRSGAGGLPRKASGNIQRSYRSDGRF